MPTVTKHSSNNLVTVSYPVSESVLDITRAEHDLILAFSTQKVKMIKFIRAQYNLSLYEAKQVVDTVIASAENEECLRNYGAAIDWNVVPKGTPVFVRDDESHDWEKRELIAYDELKFYRYFCKGLNGKGLNGNPVGWKYAKLQAEL